MCARKKLSIDIELEANLIGISSHQNDYRLCFEINKKLGYHLKRVEDHIVEPNVKEGFTHYLYCEKKQGLNHHLIANHCPSGRLIPEWYGADFFMMCEGILHNLNPEGVLKQLRETEGILAVYPIDINILSSKYNLILD